VLIDQEVEIMHDEFRASLARQGVDEEAYLKVTGKTSDELHGEWRPRAEQRAKTLLVLTAIAEAEGVTVSDADVDGEVERARVAYAGDARLVEYMSSDRGRSYIRSTLRRSRTVEKLIDDWLAGHPDHPPLPHAEDDGVTPSPEEAAAAAAADGAATDGDAPVADEVGATPAS
jgi:FKBP-type peptidyl-prolyl cis-trans isomerase (trigger factor)